MKKKAFLKRKKPLRKKSKQRIPILIEKLKKTLHPLIRERDGHVCITCDASKDRGALIDAGHYKNDGHYKSVRFDPRNINAQCRGCNRYHHGKYDLYAEKLIQKLGEDEFWDLVWCAEKGYIEYTEKKLEVLIEAAKMGYETYYEVYKQFRPRSQKWKIKYDNLKQEQTEILI